MKKLRNIFFAIMALVCVCGLASCGSDADYTVGILQLATHDALDKATEGFKAEIKENVPEGKTVKFIVKNPEGDASIMSTMATTLVRKCDLVMGNATNAALALKAAAQTEGKTNLPILFTSVTDPVDAGLVTSLTNPGGNITGTTDMNPVEKQIEIITKFDSTITKVGFIYNINEANSAVQCDLAKTYITANVATISTVTRTVSDASGITAAVNGLITDGCKAIYIPTDNLMAANMTTVANVTNAADVIVICGESSMVDNGGTFSFSIDYSELGKQTGAQACKILYNGTSTGTINVEGQTDVTKLQFVYNSSALTTMGLTMSDSFKTYYGIN